MAYGEQLSRCTAGTPAYGRLTDDVYDEERAYILYSKHCKWAEMHTAVHFSRADTGEYAEAATDSRGASTELGEQSG